MVASLPFPPARTKKSSKRARVKNLRSGGEFYIVTNIVSMPWKVDLEMLFNGIQVLDDPRIRTMSKKKLKNTYMHRIPEGSVLYVTLPPESYKCSYGRQAKYFQNMSTIEIKMDGNLCSIKIPSTGDIQITGCMDSAQALRVVSRFRELVFAVPGCADYRGLKDHRFVCQNVMNNSKSVIPFKIDGDSLLVKINEDLDFCGAATYHPNQGYSAVNIKIPASEIPRDACVTREGLSWKQHSLSLPASSRTDSARDAYIPELEEIPWEIYLEMIPEKAKEKIISKLPGKMTTFLVFRTGTFIQVSPWKESAKSTNAEFMSYMMSIRADVRDTAAVQPTTQKGRRAAARAKRVAALRPLFAPPRRSL